MIGTVRCITPKVKQLMVRQTPLLASTVHGIFSRHLRISSIESLRDTVARLPCLQCGNQTKHYLLRSTDISDVLAERVNCGRKQLPLTCSKNCADTLQKTKPDILQQYDSMMEDVEYLATPEATKLFAKVLEPSRRESTAWENNRQIGSWTEFLKLSHPDKRWLHDARAQRLLSSAYSYALTLSRFLPELLAPHHANSKRNVVLHVIGARAEAMMPRYLWNELSFFYPGRQFSITLVGDHVPVMPSCKPPSATRMNENTLIQLETINGLYHEAMAKKLATPDAFVLYNPGIGHPSLYQSWEPTVRAVLASRRPVLITSLNFKDQQRDIAALQDIVAKTHGYALQFRLKAKQNPFRSLKFLVDPCNVNMPIQTNSCVMVIQLVKRAFVHTVTNPAGYA